MAPNDGLTNVHSRPSLATIFAADLLNRVTANIVVIRGLATLCLVA